MAREMAALGRSGHLLVVSCDGPFGPYRVAKPGVLIVARESGLPIQPWAVASRPPFRLNGRWDRMIVALPFGRLRVFEAPCSRSASATGSSRAWRSCRPAWTRSRPEPIGRPACTTPAATATGVSSARAYLKSEASQPS